MPRYYYPGTTKDTVEQHKELTSKFLNLNNYFRPSSWKTGTVKWSCNNEPTGNIKIQVDMNLQRPTIRFDYKIRQHGNVEWTEMDYKLNLLSIPCNFGGHRWYFECGVTKDSVFCGKRVSVLYDCNNYFCCRHCANLSYDSCNENKRYRKGFFRILTQDHKAEEYYQRHVKRTHYNGVPTRKYRNYLKMCDSLSTEKVSSSLDEINRSLSN